MRSHEPSLLTVVGLQVEVAVARRSRRLIRDVNLTLSRAESLGLVGESGSGKSVTARAILKYLDSNDSVRGTIDYAGERVYEMDRKRLRRWHRDEVAMIYQDPRAHINPLRTVGDFLTEPMRLAKGIGRAEASERAIDVLESVGILNACDRMVQYPHQLSGGLLQRVMIASALLSGAQMIIADEPTTALDATTQEEVMAILDELRRERGLAMIVITHDLDLAAAVTDNLAVMYAGVIVETGPSGSMLHQSLHPYTTALHASRPSTVSKIPPVPIPGRPVAAWEVGDGCAFAPRCAFATELCHESTPELRPVEGHLVACHRVEEISESDIDTRVVHR